MNKETSRWRMACLGAGLLAISTLGLLAPATSAQEEADDEGVIPVLSEQFYSVTPRTGHMPVMHEHQAAAAAMGPPQTCDEEEPEEEQPWNLTDLFDDDCGGNLLKDNQFKIGGNLAQSVILNMSSPGDRFNGPVTWTDRSNEYQLNQFWLYLERATNTEESDFDLGGRVDWLLGTNYRWSTTAGFEDQWSINTNRSFYGMAFPSLYLEGAYKSVKVKVGRFVSPVGYNTVDTTLNPFWTIPYTYQYGEPFTHWGAWGNWQVDEQLVVGTGITTGWDNFDGSGTGSPNLGWLGNITYTFEDKSSIAWVGHWSNEFSNYAAHPFTSRYHQTLVYQTPLTEKLNYIIQTDFSTQGTTRDFSGTRDLGTSRWYGLNQYLIYTINDKWQLMGNFEWFRDEKGFRVGTLLPTATTPGSNTRGLPGDRFGYPGSFYAFQIGAKYNLNKNIFFRPAIRWDWFDGTAENPGAKQPFDDGTKKNQMLLGLDAVVLF